MIKDKIFREIFELIDECHGAMWPNEYDSVILSVFLLKYLNCKFERIYNILIKEECGFEDDKEEYLNENAVYLYPEYRWNVIICQKNNELFRFSLINALKFIEHENPQFIKISNEIPLNINNPFLDGFLQIINKIENNDECFWFDLYKSFINIRDKERIPESFIHIVHVIENTTKEDLFSEANSYFMHGVLDKADFFVNKALKLYPNDFDCLELKFDILEEQGLWDEAIICCDKLLKQEPQDYDLLKSKGFVYCQLNDCENAVKTYDYALSLYIDEYYLIWDKIKCLLKFNKNYEAEEVISYITNKYPEDDGLLNGIGIVYSDLGNHVSAIKYYDKSLDLVLDTDVMNNKILSLLELYGFDDDRIQDDLWEMLRELESIINPPKPILGPLICQGHGRKWHSLEEYREYWGFD